jgi:alkylhydroperoxidase/carboxymuconolactone decarboxylase family protein YurZ
VINRPAHDVSHDLDDAATCHYQLNQTWKAHNESQRREEAMTETISERPVLDLLASMTADSIAASSLDLETLALVRIAALAAVDAPAVSYLLNLEAASEVGIGAEQVRGVLAAIAPIVGTARVASATGKILDALDVAIEVADLDAQSEE